MLEHSLEFTPVDYCSQAIRKLVLTRNCSNQAFHLYNYQYIKLDQIVDLLSEINKSVQVVSNEEFNRLTQRVIAEQESETMLRIIPYLMNDNEPEEDNSIIHRDATITKKYFDKLDFSWPDIDENYLKKILGYLIID